MISSVQTRNFISHFCLLLFSVFPPPILIACCSVIVFRTAFSFYFASKEAEVTSTISHAELQGLDIEGE